MMVVLMSEDLCPILESLLCDVANKDAISVNPTHCLALHPDVTLDDNVLSSIFTRFYLEKNTIHTLHT